MNELGKGKHSQIPELFAHFEQDKYLYLVQEYIDGKNLDQTLKEEGIFNETQIRELLLSLLPVVQFIHENNVIHRDIKPENIIKRRTGNQYILVDFGAAKYFTGTFILKPGTIIGDPRYMPDEQLEGKADFTSDLYSLGLTCLHLLTQIETWDLYNRREGKWVWRDYLTIPISDSLGQVLNKMVQKTMNQRYQSATEVLNALNPIITLTPSPNFQTFKTTNQTTNPKTVSPPPKISQPSSSQVVSTTLQTIPTPFELGGKWGYEDANGKVAIKIQFDGAAKFFEGLARVRIGSKWGYIRPPAKLIIFS